MPESMTGFGSASATEDGVHVSVEVRALNSRGMDVSVRGDRGMTPSLEREIRHLIRETFERGQFSVHVKVTHNIDGLPIDVKALKERIEAYKGIFEGLGIMPSDDRLIEMALDHSTLDEDDRDDRLYHVILKTFKKAIKELKRERRIEGKKLLSEIKGRLRVLESYLKTIEKGYKPMLEELKEGIYKRIVELIGDNSERAWMEASILADRADIREEMVRFRSHIDRFKEILKGNGAIGRRLDFLCQEMHREANTLATKLPALSEIVVDAKSEIEKMRQQLSNLE